MCEAMKVVLPKDAAWVGDWIDEHAAFPNARHDERVDNTSAALERLAQVGMGISKEMAQPIPLGVSTGDDGGVPRQPKAAPEFTANLKGKTKDQRLAQLMGEWQSVGTR